jgi:1-acyl-sn-glycerol-3-phosphate acyltransferase
MNIQQNHTQLLNIEHIIKAKNPRLYKLLPAFVIKYIKKTIHQDELNSFIIQNFENNGIQFLKNSFLSFDIKSSVKNIENLPETWKIILISNHPIGSFDGLHIIDILHTKYKKVKAVVNDLLLNIKNLNEFFVGVNKHGTTQREQVKLLNGVFSSDYPIFFFPSGLVSRKTKGKISDGDWKKTFISRAIKHERNVVPIHINGKLSKRFYRIANLRKLLRIKSNLEMFYLVDELFRQKGNTIIITIGKPISFQKFDSSKTHFEWAQEVKAHVYKLADDNTIEF